MDPVAASNLHFFSTCFFTPQQNQTAVLFAAEESILVQKGGFLPTPLLFPRVRHNMHVAAELNRASLPAKAWNMLCTHIYTCIYIRQIDAEKGACRYILAFDKAR